MINSFLNNNAKKTDAFLKKYLNLQNNTSLMSAMKYGSLSGGKKIRSSMVIGAGKLFNIKIIITTFNQNKFWRMFFKINTLNSIIIF